MINILKNFQEIIFHHQDHVVISILIFPTLILLINHINIINLEQALKQKDHEYYLIQLDMIRKEKNHKNLMKIIMKK